MTVFLLGHQIIVAFSPSEVAIRAKLAVSVVATAIEQQFLTSLCDNLLLFEALIKLLILFLLKFIVVGLSAVVNSRNLLRFFVRIVGVKFRLFFGLDHHFFLSFEFLG